MSPPVARPSVAALLAATDAIPTRVLCTGGVVWASAGDGRWQAAADDAGNGDEPTDDPRPALGVAAVDRWLATHGVWPVALATPDAGRGERLTLVSAAGALGWRPPLDVLAAVGSDAVDGGHDAAEPALRRAALRLRPLVDAAEQHALDAAERYARAAATAARVARLLHTPALDTVGVAPGLFVAVDALAGAALRTLAAADALAAEVFGRGLLGAPATLRAALLDVRAMHAVPAVPRRRALRREAAAGLGPPVVRVRRLRVAGAGVWAARVPVGAPWRAGRDAGAPVDAFEAAWALATESWRALTLVVYASAGAWTFD
ncbi:hypothetical protein tb265_14520 [Gemmatimonadetes bacterium T265]|nr:hypothetical protein tb265_14520 [Gemmatimonadetes bacterium T265]